jgi:hypothetical protein
MIEILWFLSEQLLRHRDSYEDERSENVIVLMLQVV